VSAVLLCLAAALVLWPVAGGRRRLGAVGAVGFRPRRPAPVALAGPVPAAAVALLAGALISTPLVAVLAAGCAGLAMRAWTRRRRAARNRAQLAGLVEALGALGAELRAGRSLADAVRSGAGACAEPAVGEALARALHDPRAEPAAGTAAEVGAALDRIAAAVRLSARTGCSLASVVAAVEDDLRARLRRELDLSSATAAPRAGAALLAGLPLLGLAMGAGVGADPWGVLTTTGAGQVLLLAGVALEVTGVVWSGHLVRRALR
jgi:tight adherence protein B